MYINIRTLWIIDLFLTGVYMHTHVYMFMTYIYVAYANTGLGKLPMSVGDVLKW